LDRPEHGHFLFQFLSIGWEQQNGVMVRFDEGRAGEGFVCIVEVRVAMVENATSLFNMLIKFRKPCSQISHVKIPSYNKCSLRMYGFQFTESSEFFSGPLRYLLGGDTLTKRIEEKTLGI
jgi:hypothetical protein